MTDILGFDVNSSSMLKLIHADLESQLNEKPEVKSMIENLADTIAELIAYECFRKLNLILNMMKSQFLS